MKYYASVCYQLDRNLREIFWRAKANKRALDILLYHFYENETYSFNIWIRIKICIEKIFFSFNRMLYDAYRTIPLGKKN